MDSFLNSIKSAENPPFETIRQLTRERSRNPVEMRSKTLSGNGGQDIPRAYLSTPRPLSALLCTPLHAASLCFGVSTRTGGPFVSPGMSTICDEACPLLVLSFQLDWCNASCFLFNIIKNVDVSTCEENVTGKSTWLSRTLRGFRALNRLDRVYEALQLTRNLSCVWVWGHHKSAIDNNSWSVFLFTFGGIFAVHSMIEVETHYRLKPRFWIILLNLRQVFCFSQQVNRVSAGSP